MSNEFKLPLHSLSIQGYRSFGPEPQRFERFGKINLFIGRNNSGKSNVLKLISEVIPAMFSSGYSPSFLDRHVSNPSKFLIGTGLEILHDHSDGYPEFEEHIRPLISAQFQYTQVAGYLINLLQRKAKSDNSNSAWFECNEKRELHLESWDEAFSELNNSQVLQMWEAVQASRGGDRKHNWEPDIVRKVARSISATNTYLIPAIRKIGTKDTESEEIGGYKLIEKLAKLQNPDVEHQSDKIKLEKINEFLRTVTDNPTAEIEIPHDRDTIIVHMDGKSLPLDNLGTGIHEVLILAADATVNEKMVICMEEPELHLNPLLQKKLIRYLDASTNNQYFITTHSNALMDTLGLEIYHLKLVDGCSIATRVSTDSERFSVCEDLGYHPSDLLQANCVVWVEGPSDRIYLNWWINEINDKLVEGIHYSVMFYGGRLAAHVSGADTEDLVDDFISLRRLNRRGAILIDSDRSKKGGRINSTKIRLRDEFDVGPGFAWITKGREVENYIDTEVMIEAIRECYPSAKINKSLGMHDNILKTSKIDGGSLNVNKVKIANYVTENYDPNLDNLDLKTQLNSLLAFIVDSNPGLEF